MTPTALLLQIKEGSRLRLFEFSCGCKSWVRVDLHAKSHHFGRRVTGCDWNTGDDPSNRLAHDVYRGNLSAEIERWMELV